MEADLIVIGGGIIGLTTARLFQLRHPRARLVLLEQAMVGTGASGYGGAADVDYAWSDAHRDLILRGRRVRAAFPGAFETSTAVRTAWVSDRADPEDLAQRVLDADLTRMPSETQSTLPVVLHPGEYAFGARTGKVGSPAAACRAYCSALRKGGALIREAIRVDAINPAPGGLRVTCANGETLSAPHVISCTGPWAAGQNWAADTVRARTKKIVAFHIEARLDYHDLQVQYDHSDIYLIPDPLQPGRLILCLHSDQWDVGPGDQGLCLDAADMAQGRAALARIAPELLGRLQGGRVFCDAYGPDKTPLARASEALPGLVLAGFCSGSGFYLAPGLADQALQLIEETLANAAE